MVWIDCESVRFIGPAFDDVLVGREAFEGFQPFRVIVGVDEGCEMFAQLIVA